MSAFKYFYSTYRRTLVRGRFRARGGAGRTLEAAVASAALFAALALALALAAAGRAEAQPGEWKPRRAMPTPRRLLAAAVLEGPDHKTYAYALGGCGSACFEPPLQTSIFEETRVEVYNPASNAWDVSKKPMPTILFGAAAVAPGNGKIYTLGGVVSGNVVQEYEPMSDSWTLRQPMPTPRYGLAAVALDGKIYALGGNGPSNAVEVYDPATDTWSSRAPLLTARVFLAAAVAGGKVYAIGGSPDCCGGSQTDVVEVYYPAADRWETAAPLPMALQLSAAVAFNGLIYTFGGFVPGSGVTGATFQYTPALDAWTRQPDMPTPRDEAPAVVLDGNAYVLGGAVQCHCQALPDIERFPLQPNPPMADLAVDLTGSARSACERVHFRIAVTNLGPDPASGALVEDQFPPELTHIAWTCTPSGRCRKPTSGHGNIEQQVDLPAGGSLTYDVSAKFKANASGSLTDTAKVEPPAGLVDPQLDNNRKTFTTPIGCAADLEVHSIVPPVLAAGTTFPYLVTVTDHGPCCAKDTVLVVTLRAGLEFAGLEFVTPPPLPSGCVAGGGQLTCHLGTICPGQVAQVSATVGAPCNEPAGPIASLARVTSATCDPVLANNSQGGVTQVEVVADYAIVKTVISPPPAVAGSSLDYLLVVTKEGPSCPAGVTVVDAFPPALFGVQWCLLCQDHCCTPPRNGNLLAVVDLAAKASQTFLVTATISPAICVLLPISPPVFMCGTVSNTACVAAQAGVDHDPSNDCSAVTTVVVPPGHFVPLPNGPR
jgi:uncharacterized repeat protein (TIGR01451 family)